MENPFKKLFGKPKVVAAVSMETAEPSAEEEKVVDTSFENHGDYWEAYALSDKGEIPGTRTRLNANPDDKESLEAEYAQYRKDFGLED